MQKIEYIQKKGAEEKTVLRLEKPLPIELLKKTSIEINQIEKQWLQNNLVEGHSNRSVQMVYNQKTCLYYST